MITLDDILKIDNINLYSYLGHTYKHDDKYPIDESYPPHEIWVDLDYPISKEISYGELSLLRTQLSINNTRVLNAKEMIEDHLKDHDLFLQCDYLQYGDYDNSCMVERSNYKIFIEEYGDLSFVFKVFGGYGSTGIALSLKGLLNPDNEDKALEIIELLNNLNDYPCIDDEDMSNMEYDSFIESLNDYGYKDSMTALSKKFNLDIYDYDEEKFKEILLEADRNLNYPSYMIESGGICYIDIDRLIEPITLNILKPILKDYEVKS